MDHGLCQKGSGGGAVACYIIGLGSDFFDQLRTHVFKWILQLDLASDGDAIIDDVRSAESLVEYDVATFRSQGNFYCICQLIDTS
ncbi:Uncharacterised protein [Bacteroides xylanisolvens]|nr:Uncharacterised protein [Bacteroides xylanisolvens]